MPILDIQRRGIPIGRIRCGRKVIINGKEAPSKTDTFRLTSPSQDAIRQAADKFGGEATRWEQQQQWQVLTPLSRLYVLIPPRDAIVSQWYEMWTAGGCVRRCDSQRDRISGGECLCPHASDPGNADEVDNMARQRAELAKIGQACKIKTRISLMLPDLQGIGVWRLDTGSFYAAGEIGDIAGTLEMARARNLFLPATATIDQRFRVANGRRTPYPVPVLQTLNTFREIASGQLEAGGIMAQLPPPPGEAPRAITAGPTGTEPTPAAAPADAPAEPDLQDDGRGRAQQIADLAAIAGSREDVEKLAERAKAEGLNDHLIYADPDDDACEELKSYLQHRWQQIGRPGYRRSA